jgi:hypothetical protein
VLELRLLHLARLRRFMRQHLLQPMLHPFQHLHRLPPRQFLRWPQIGSFLALAPQ